MKRSWYICAILFLLAGIPARAPAITINPTYAGFTASEQAVIDDAINYWTTMVGGHTIQIDLTADATMPSPGDRMLASTGVPVGSTDSGGRPTNADITVRVNALDWTTGNPAAGQYDGMGVTMHEIGHALGFSDAFWIDGQTGQPILNNFGNNVRTVQGNAFYDLNHDSAYSANTDFDLLDNDHAHAADNPRDLMNASVNQGERHYPTYQHAGVLTDAYAYDVMLDGLGGTDGYGELAMGRNDDGSSNQLNLPFEINFFGNTYDKFS